MTGSDPQIFISYAHIDNQKIEGAKIGWVDRLYESLEIELQQAGIDFHFWRDKRDLEKDEFFDDAILGAVKSSRILVAILSPVYPKRSYCLKEMSHFVESADPADERQAARRIMKVIKQPIDDEIAASNLPDYLEGRVGFQFYTIDRQENRLVRYVRSNGEIVRKNEYWDVLQELSEAIQRHLATGTDTQQQGSSGLVVYLAETSNDLDDSARTIRAELKGKGYRVLPEGKLPLGEKEAIDLVNRDLSEAAISIHLLGKRSGYVPDGDTGTPIVPLQLDLAAKHGAAHQDFQRIIWARQDLQAAQPHQAKILADLSSGALLLDNDDFIQEPLELFKTTVLNTLAQKEQGRVADSSRPHAHPRSIFLVYHPDDASAVKEIRKKLFQQGHEVWRPDFSGDQQQQDEAFHTYAAKADAALVYYGTTSEVWVQQVLLRLGDWNALKRSGPMKTKAVFIGGEPSENKADFMTLNADLTLNTIDLPQDDAIKTFITHLNA